MLSRQRRGLTLVELMVVIAIISLLVALLLPAVQAAREAARRASCASNLKELGLASHEYHATHDSFPNGGIGPVGAAFASLKHHGTGAYLLPYLEQQELFGNYRWDISWFDPPNQQVVTTQLSVWQCPSAEQDRIQEGPLPTIAPPPVRLFDGAAAAGDYAGMRGVDAELARRGLIDPAATYDEDEGVFPLNDTVTAADIVDGTSHTIMFVECAGRPQLWQGGAEIPEKFLSGAGWASRNSLFGRGAAQDGASFAGPCAINCTNDREVYSFHADGANAVFADGSVHFLKADMGIREMARLITRAGEEVASSGDF